MNRSRGAFHERVLDAHLTAFYYFKEGNSIQEGHVPSFRLGRIQGEPFCVKEF